MPHEVDKFGYAADPWLRELEIRIGAAACTWRGYIDRNDVENAERTVIVYHAYMDLLYTLGWDGYLDVDSELPDHLMPEEYMKRQAEWQAKREAKKLDSKRSVSHDSQNK